MGQDPSGLLFPVAAKYRFWLAVSPKGAVLLGAPSSPRLIFERHLMQLSDDTHPVPDRQDAKQRLAEKLVKKGWERWAVALLPVDVESGATAGGKCEIAGGEVRISGRGTPQSLTAAKLEAALGLRWTGSPGPVTTPGPTTTPGPITTGWPSTGRWG